MCWNSAKLYQIQPNFCIFFGFTKFFLVSYSAFWITWWFSAPRPDLWHLERPVGEAFEAEVGLVVVLLEEESRLAGVVGAQAEGGGLTAAIVPH